MLSCRRQDHGPWAIRVADASVSSEPGTPAAGAVDVDMNATDYEVVMVSGVLLTRWRHYV